MREGRPVFRTLLAELVALTAFATPADRAVAAVLQVPADYFRLQEALDAAAPGDTVLVAGGDYLISAALTFRGKALALRAAAGPEATVIRRLGSPDEERPQVIVFENGEGPDAVLDGFTVTGASGGAGAEPPFGGGVLVRAASPRIVNCAIEGNRAGNGGGIACLAGAAPVLEGCRIGGNLAGGSGAQGRGGGVFAEESSPTLIRCEVSGNEARHPEDGGGLFARDAAVRLEDCEISANRSGGLSCVEGTLTLLGCLISGNDGAGIGLLASRASLTRCRISANAQSGVVCRESPSAEIFACIVADNGEGGLSCSVGASPLIRFSTISGNTGGGVLASDGASPEITGSIIWDNPGGPLLAAASTTPLVSFSCLESNPPWPGQGNLSSDPLFCGGGPAGEVFVDASQNGPGDGTAASPYPALEPALGYSLALSPNSPCRGAGPGGADLGAPEGTCGEPGAASRVVRLAPGSYHLDGLGLAHRISLAGSGEDRTTIRGTVRGLRTGSTLSGVSVTGGPYGVVLEPGESPEIDRSTFFGIRGGAAVFREGSAPRLTRVAFRENLFGVSALGASPRMADCTITGTASSGFFSTDGGSPVLERCSVRANGGTGVSCRNGSSPTLLDCDLSENNELDIEVDRGGGAAASGGGSLTLIRCAISSNRGTGVTCRQGASATLINCTVLGNVSVATPAGGFYSEDASARLVNCLITGNRGGGVHFAGAPGAVLFNCTIAENPGGGVACAAGAVPVLTNCVVWAESDGDRVACGELVHTLASRDPLFRRPGRFDFGRFREPVAGRPFELPDFIDDAGDYRLRPGSPASDAGDPRGAPADDLAGRARPCGAEIDLGAYESDCPVEERSYRRADANADGRQDLSDAVTILGFLFLGDAGAIPCRKSADVTDDGVLDLSDAISLLLHLFLGGTRPPDPFGECGRDPSPDGLDCEAFPPCG